MVWLRQLLTCLVAVKMICGYEATSPNESSFSWFSQVSDWTQSEDCTFVVPGRASKQLDNASFQVIQMSFKPSLLRETIMFLRKEAM